MATKPKRPKLEDEAQSQRFIEAAQELEAAGGLSPTEAEEAFEEAVAKVLPEARPKPKPRQGD